MIISSLLGLVLCDASTVVTFSMGFCASRGHVLLGKDSHSLLFYNKFFDRNIIMVS